LNKKAIFGSQRCEDSDSDGSINRENGDREKVEVWNKPRRDEVKMIDFGGATYDHEYHT
jgi:hypothetical protein